MSDGTLAALNASSGSLPERANRVPVTDVASKTIPTIAAAKVAR